QTFRHGAPAGDPPVLHRRVLYPDDDVLFACRLRHHAAQAEADCRWRRRTLALHCPISYETHPGSIIFQKFSLAAEIRMRCRAETNRCRARKSLLQNYDNDEFAVTFPVIKMLFPQRDELLSL